ncbi:unnamed protein product [Fusarium equiseti]|uniref:Uncharacterized protein n=1 Tax=Fusarium equiseti TaxID=61235 RepID=A0A8J2IJN7_FUSEQ|nr:unnamed protein product [Fusarium equiseti]
MKFSLFSRSSNENESNMTADEQEQFVANPGDAHDLTKQAKQMKKLDHLDSLSDEHQTLVKHLKTIWQDNWYKYPEHIRQSFHLATTRVMFTESNQKNASNHALWKKAISSKQWDFDWGIWLVLRATYYDTVKPKDAPKRTSFRHGQASVLIAQRYKDCDVMQDLVPVSFPPRPREWDVTSRAGQSEPPGVQHQPAGERSKTTVDPRKLKSQVSLLSSRPRQSSSQPAYRNGFKAINHQRQRSASTATQGSREVSDTGDLSTADGLDGSFNPVNHLNPVDSTENARGRSEIDAHPRQPPKTVHPFPRFDINTGDDLHPSTANTLHTGSLGPTTTLGTYSNPAPGPPKTFDELKKTKEVVSSLPRDQPAGFNLSRQSTPGFASNRNNNNPFFSHSLGNRSSQNATTFAQDRTGGPQNAPSTWGEAPGDSNIAPSEALLNQVQQALQPWIENCMRKNMDRFNHDAQNFFTQSIEERAKRLSESSQESINRGLQATIEEIKSDVCPWFNQELQKRVEDFKAKIEVTVNRFLNGMQPWIVDQIQAEVTNQITQVKAEMQPCIVDQIQAEVTKQFAQDKAKKAELKRKFQTFQESQAQAQDE